MIRNLGIFLAVTLVALGALGAGSDALSALGMTRPGYVALVKEDLGRTT